MKSSGPSERKNATLSRARRTSGADENCWRTPPSALPLAPDAIVAELRKHDLVGAGRGEVVGDRGADDAAAGYDVAPASHSSSRATSSSSRSRSGARTSGRSGTPFHAAMRFSAACRGNVSTRARRSASERRALGGRLADDRGHLVRERRGERRHRSRPLRPLGRDG